MISISNSISVRGGVPVPLPPKGVNLDGVGTLYKHCNSKHIPTSGSRIQLGTLSDFRKHENRAVQDEFEGKFRVTLEFADGMEISRNWLDEMSFGTIPFELGRVSNSMITQVISAHRTVGVVSSVGEIEIQAVEKGRTEIKGNVDFLFEGADAWVFCLSRSKDQVIDDPAYDSIWSIRPEKLEAFLRAISQGLFDEWGRGGNLFKEETVGPLRGPGFTVPNTGALKPIVFFDIQEVKYSNREVRFERESDDGIQMVHSTIAESAYTKALKFLPEAETRVIIRPAFVAEDNGPRFLLPNYLRPVLLPADPILDFIN